MFENNGVGFYNNNNGSLAFGNFPTNQGASIFNGSGNAPTYAQYTPTGSIGGVNSYTLTNTPNGSGSWFSNVNLDGLSKIGNTISGIGSLALGINQAIQNRKAFNENKKSMELERAALREKLDMARKEYARLNKNRSAVTAAYGA